MIRTRPTGYRDEARAYRDEVREWLPLAYGLVATIRLDEYSLQAAGDNVLDLLNQIQQGEVP